MTREARLWVAAAGYVLVTLVPLFAVLVGPVSPDRGFWIEFPVALGFIGLAMLGLQSVLTARFPSVSAALGQDALLQFHRQTGLVAFAFVLAHPVILLLADGDNWAFLDPRKGFLRAAFLIIVLLALPAIIVSSLWRDRLRIPYEWWRLGHGALALLIVLIGLVHINRVRYYLADGWKQALWIAIGAASMGSVLYVRALKPLRVRRHPWTVTAVEPVSDRTWSLTVEPDGGDGLPFAAGQFVFLTIADNPFSLEQHPFSIASSARTPGRLEFGVKELGDYTDRIGEVAVGSRAFVDGPYGSLTLPEGDAAGLMFVAGGIGVTPIVSMLRTLADEGRTLPVTLLYGNEQTGAIAYDEELDALAGVLPLTVVHVLDDPPPGWDGERGRITEDVVRRHLPPVDPADWRYVLCGPPPMMETAEQALVAAGVPVARIESERFDIGAAGAVGRRATRIRRLVLGLAAVMLAAAAAFAA
jgi:predicted ferric reductase